MLHSVSPNELNGLLASDRLAPGDTVMLTGGTYERVHLRGLVDVTLTASSQGVVVDGGEGSGLIAEDCQSLTVENITARGAGRKYHNKQGVGILVKGGRDIKVKNCRASGFQRAGFEVRGVQGLLFQQLEAWDNGFSGIHVTRGDDGSPSQNVHLTGCSAVNNPGDPTVTNSHSGNGIVLYHTGDALVEYCAASYNGWDMNNLAFNGPVGIWTANCHKAVFRYCLSHDNRTQWGKTDGGGFDFDGGTRDSLMEYCYSYHNNGAGYLVCQYKNADELSGNTIRYSASFNDGTGHHKSAVYLFDCGSASLAKGGDIYRNLLLNSQGRDIVRGHLDDTVVRDNIMLLDGDGQFFNHEYDDSGLALRGSDRQKWGEAAFTGNLTVNTRESKDKDEMRKFIDYPFIQNPEDLKAYFRHLNLESRQIT